jgi:hypothetical protein
MATFIFQIFRPASILMTFTAELLFFSEKQAPIMAGSPPVRAHHALVYDSKSEAVFMTGGSTPLDGGQRFEFFNDTWKYNGIELTNFGESGTKRSGVALAYNSKEDNIYSFGGYSGGSYKSRSHCSFWWQDWLAS